MTKNLGHKILERPILALKVGGELQGLYINLWKGGISAGRTFAIPRGELVILGRD